jgi:hypothetical protein
MLSINGVNEHNFKHKLRLADLIGAKSRMGGAKRGSRYLTVLLASSSMLVKWPTKGHLK